MITKDFIIAEAKKLGLDMTDPNSDTEEKLAFMKDLLAGMYGVKHPCLDAGQPAGSGGSDMYLNHKPKGRTQIPTPMLREVHITEECGVSKEIANAWREYDTIVNNTEMDKTDLDNLTIAQQAVVLELNDLVGGGLRDVLRNTTAGSKKLKTLDQVIKDRGDDTTGTYQDNGYGKMLRETLTYNNASKPCRHRPLVDEGAMDLIHKRVRAMVIDKSNDYGEDILEISGLSGNSLSLLQKAHRYYNLVYSQQKFPSYESVEDTLRDMIGYATIGLLLLNRDKE